jgi:nucleotide-binding universal stress UspA family protein
MSTIPASHTFKILLAVDGSLHSEAAVKLTVGMPWPARASISVLVVIPEHWSFTNITPEARQLVEETLASVSHAYRVNAERFMAQAVERIRVHTPNITAEVREGRPPEIILQRASELPADLIVIGAKGLGTPSEFHMGSTAHKLVDSADCAVLVARPSERPQPVSVLLAADGSPEALRAAEFLCTLSLPKWADVTVISVAETPAGLSFGERGPAGVVSESVRRSLLDTAEACAAAVIEHLQSCGAQVERLVTMGHPAMEILSAARERDADLIVMGAHGLARADRFHLGGAAQKVVKYAPYSVLIVR